MNFSKDESVDMVYALGEAQRNPFLASRIYAQQYPTRRHPHHSAFERLKERFESTGSVGYNKQHRFKTVTNEENEMQVVLSVTEDPHISSRKISIELGLSQTSVTRMLRKNKFHPYHIQMLQELLPTDYEKRSNFCVWVLNKTQQQYNFVDSVLFSDESTFHKNGFVNMHNCHYYDTSNPHFVRTVDYQHRWSINVWAGIVGRHLIGPYFFDRHLNGHMYCEFLQNEFEEMINNLPLNIRRTLWFQQDGAPAHFSRQVTDHLNARFGNHWIGRGGPVQWPPRSPDLTKLDFFLSGYVKDNVYKTHATTKDDMMDRIRQAFQNITADMLQDVSNAFLLRVRTCSRQNGGHFEHILH